MKKLEEEMNSLWCPVSNKNCQPKCIFRVKGRIREQEAHEELNRVEITIRQLTGEEIQRARVYLCDPPYCLLISFMKKLLSR